MFKIFVPLLSVIILMIMDSGGTHLKDLFINHTKANLAFYKVNKTVAENYMKSVTEDDVCRNGRDIHQVISDEFIGRHDIDPSEHVVAFVGYGEWTSDVLKDAPCHLQDSVESSIRLLGMALTDFEMQSGEYAAEMITMFTDSPKQIFNPWLNSDVKYIDSIVEEGGMVTLRDGSDVMRVIVPVKPCQNGDVTRADKGEWEHGERELWLSLTGSHDWSICDTLEWNVPFCRKIEAHMCELSRVGTDYCVGYQVLETTNLCESFMEVTEMTGIFREASLLPEGVPLETFDVSWMDASFMADITFPCL